MYRPKLHSSEIGTGSPIWQAERNKEKKTENGTSSTESKDDVHVYDRGSSDVMVSSDSGEAKGSGTDRYGQRNNRPNHKSNHREDIKGPRILILNDLIFC